MSGTTLYMMLPDEGEVAEVQPVCTGEGQEIETCGTCGREKLCLVPNPLEMPPAPDETTVSLMDKYCTTRLGDAFLWPDGLEIEQ